MTDRALSFIHPLHGQQPTVFTQKTHPMQPIYYSSTLRIHRREMPSDTGVSRIVQITLHLHDDTVFEKSLLTFIYLAIFLIDFGKFIELAPLQT